MIELQPAPESAPESDRLTLTVTPPGGPATTYACELTICDVASCGCRDIGFTCRPCADDGSVDESAKLEFWLDPFQMCSADELVDPPTGPGVTLGRTVAEQLTMDQWEGLVRRFMDAKQQAIERLVPEREVDAYFPFEEVERSGKMVGYADVLPFARSPFFEHRGRSYTFDDQYCVQSDCDCRYAILTVARGDSPLGVTAPDDPVLEVDYAERRWKDGATGGRPRGSVGKLQQALVEQIPELYDLLRKRHTTLRKMYRVALAYQGPYLSCAQVDPPAPAAPARKKKVGRNEPCPCGSGKKYKKCCGR